MNDFDYEGATRRFTGIPFDRPVLTGWIDDMRAAVAIALGGETLYRKAEDCVFGTRHWVGEHGKPCLECGAEQIWVVPVEVKE